MMPLIRVGDPLRPYGGAVLEGRYLAIGQPVACMGDKVRCDKHGDNRIAQGAVGFEKSQQSRTPVRRRIMRYDVIIVGGSYAEQVNRMG